MRSIHERAERVLSQARELAGRVESWAEFCHALFDPDGGIVPRAFPTVRERREFTMTPQYAAVYDLLHDRMATSAAAEGRRPDDPVPGTAADGPPWVIPFPGTEDRDRPAAGPAARPKSPSPGPLSASRVADILGDLARHNYSDEADALRCHIQWLESERDKIGQYYEEYLIPLLEGRPIGKHGLTWAERLRDEVDRERTP